MAYPVRVAPGAERDVAEAAAWYGRRTLGLADAFLDAFQDVVTCVSATPEAFPRLPGVTRRIVMRRFPYAVFYLFDGGEVVILACLHERRSPDNWPAG